MAVTPKLSVKGYHSKYVWLDGKFSTNARVPITTHAIHYGTSIFEGVRAYWSKKNLYIFRLDDHIKRLRESGKYYSIPLRFSNKEIKNAIIQLCKKNKAKKSCYIRPFYYIGEYGINLHVTKKTPTHLAMFMFPIGELYSKKGISVGISSWRKFSDASTPTQAKMGGNYLNSIIAIGEAKKNGYDEAILLDMDGYVSEAPVENVFAVRGNTIMTPPTSSSALDGITRDTVLRLAKDMGYKTVIRKFRSRTLYEADEVFLTGTAAEVVPVISIDKKKIGTKKPGEITRKLVQAYSDTVTNKNPKYSHWLTEVYT